jgi:leucyl aminopeptidase (aminopeptidase T)
MGGARDLELLENLAVQVRKRGAFPFITLESERMSRRMYLDVPPKYDTQTPELWLRLAEFVTAVFTIEWQEKEDLLADIPPARIAAQNQAFERVQEKWAKRPGWRAVHLGNGLSPTAARAARFGVSQAELARVFWNAVEMDYARLRSKGEAVKKLLAAGSELHLTHPNGTDLKLRIAGRPVFVNDGVISEEERRQDVGARIAVLPAGEVYLTPDPGTAEGKIVIDRHFHQGREVRGLTLTVRAGKLVSMTAKSGLERLRAEYEAAGPGKEIFGFIDLGINPNIPQVLGKREVGWMPAGMVTVGFGNNEWAGGENKAVYGLGCSQPGTTLKVDGKMLVENGTLK